MHTIQWPPRKPVKSHATFGSSMERKMFPVHTAPTRMGIEQVLRGAPNRGPGCYEDDLLDIFPREMKRRPCSIKGSGFGARLSKRASLPSPSASNPGPAAYQSISTKPVTTPAYLPFESAMERFKPDKGDDDVLGPGSHDLDLSLNRRVNFDEAFGGLKKLKNTITVKCTMGIPDQCKKCHQEPLGDYYGNRHYSLCRPCYDQLSQGGVASPLCLKGMKKVRDCKSIHRHDFPGRPSKTIIMTEKEQKKIRYKEAYMGLYYS